MLTTERLRDILHYNPETGLFTWLPRPDMPKQWRVRFEGRTAGTTKDAGSGLSYVVIRIDGKQYLAHRLAWLYVHGRWPEKHLDHEKGNGLDNKFTNLRPCVPTENHQNRVKQSNNTSGYVGVSKSKKKWQANICINRKQHFLGLFATPQEASVAYEKAKRELHLFTPITRQAI